MKDHLSSKENEGQTLVSSKELSGSENKSFLATLAETMTQYNLEYTAQMLIFDSEISSEKKILSLNSLLNEGLAIDSIINEDKTMLFFATQILDKNLVKFLLENNATVWTSNPQNNPLLLAKYIFTEASFAAIDPAQSSDACDILNMLMISAIYSQNLDSRHEFINFAKSDYSFFSFGSEKYNLIDLMYPENLAAIAENFSENLAIMSYCEELLKYKLENGAEVKPEIIQRINNVVRDIPAKTFAPESYSSLTEQLSEQLER